MDAATILANKKETRATVLARRNAIPANARTSRSGLICERMFDVASRCVQHVEEQGEAPLVAVFSSFGSEVSLTRFEELALEHRYRLCYPAMVKAEASPSAVMEFFEVPEALIRSKAAGFLAHPARAYTVEEVVSEGCSRVSLDEIDFAVVPLVAFDGRGGRLGYGGGNYDAFLSARRSDTKAYAIAFAEQEVDEVPREAHDLPVDGVVFG